jgi:solute carrier family 8 (sodium/calcium exchanger)
MLGWFFLGIAISSDIFMEGIEKITSQKQRIPHPLDKTRKVTVAVWNYTVANLTLMAFGSSTPEILLSIIELISKDMFTGELGASTIVGSASFNLFIIIGVCISVIPPTEVRMI